MPVTRVQNDGWGGITPQRPWAIEETPSRHHLPGYPMQSSSAKAYPGYPMQYDHCVGHRVYGKISRAYGPFDEGHNCVTCGWVDQGGCSTCGRLAPPERSFQSSAPNLIQATQPQAHRLILKVGNEHRRLANGMHSWTLYAEVATLGDKRQFNTRPSVARAEGALRHTNLDYISLPGFSPFGVRHMKLRWQEPGSIGVFNEAMVNTPPFRISRVSGHEVDVLVEVTLANGEVRSMVHEVQMNKPDAWKAYELDTSSAEPDRYVPPRSHRESTDLEALITDVLSLKG